MNLVAIKIVPYTYIYFKICNTYNPITYPVAIVYLQDKPVAAGP